VTGFFIHKNMDFVCINSRGISILEIGGSHHTRNLVSDRGEEYMLHSLESSNYLKIDRSNFIKFQFANEEKVLSIISQYQTKNKFGELEDDFETVYNLRISKVTLRELLLL